MALFYVTGVSGSGKSEVLKELRNRGFEAYGIDEDGYGKWINKETGQVEILREDLGTDIHEWYKTHRWFLDEDKINKLKIESDIQNKNVFLCGVAEGEDLIWDSFSGVFALVIDEPTIRNRIDQRQNNQFGKTNKELEDILKWSTIYDETYSGFGAIIIDACQPLALVVDEIVSHLN